MKQANILITYSLEGEVVHKEVTIPVDDNMTVRKWWGKYTTQKSHDDSLIVFGGFAVKKSNIITVDVEIPDIGSSQ